MDIFGAGGSSESALDAFLTDPDLRDIWFSNADRSALHTILEERAKKTVQPQESFAEALVIDDDREEGMSEPLLRLKIAPDEMMVWVIIRDFSRDVDAETLESMIYSELEREQVTFGMKKQQITRMVRAPLYDKPMLVAQGRRPQENKDGAVTFQFKPASSLRPNKADGYHVDPHNPDFVSFVKAGALLCTSSRTTNDFTGKTVRGRVVHPLQGGIDEIFVGENVRMSADGTKWYALIDGEVIVKERTISVLPVLHLENVDTSTGDIHFHGSVYVTGNVESGRTVVATENVVVGGVVQNGIIQAGRHLAVGGGIKGAEDTSIQVGGSLRTPFVEYMKIAVEGNIYADVLFGADIVCQGGIYAIGKRGRIVAGKCAAREIEADQLGNEANAKTLLEILPISTMEDRLTQLREELESWDSRARKMRRIILDTENPARRQIFEHVMEQIEGEKKEAHQQAEQLYRKIDFITRSYSMEIRVAGDFNPKVSCIISGVTHDNEKSFVGVRVYYAGGKIRMGSWSYDEA